MNLRSRIEALEGGGDGYTSDELVAALAAFEQFGELPPAGSLCRVTAGLVRTRTMAIAATWGAAEPCPGNDFHNRIHERLKPWHATTDRVVALLLDMEEGNGSPAMREELLRIVQSGWTARPPLAEAAAS